MLPIVFDGMKESDFLFLSAVILLLCLFLVLAGGIHTGFDFPELLRICPDGFELGIGFIMLLLQSGILCFQLMAVKLAVRELSGQFAAGLVELFQFGRVVRLVLLFGAGELDDLVHVSRWHPIQKKVQFMEVLFDLSAAAPLQFFIAFIQKCQNRFAIPQFQRAGGNMFIQDSKVIRILHV